jgi:hypothetical protein
MTCQQTSHNPEVAGSNPAPATRKALENRAFSFLERAFGSTCEFSARLLLNGTKSERPPTHGGPGLGNAIGALEELLRRDPSAIRNSFVPVLAILANDPHPKDVMISVFGASAGVAGLVLVFVGVLITTVGMYPGGTSKSALRPYRVGAWAAIAAFGVSLITVALSLLWLAVNDSQVLYIGTLVLFGGLLVALFALAVAVTRATV